MSNKVIIGIMLVGLIVAGCSVINSPISTTQPHLLTTPLPPINTPTVPTSTPTAIPSLTPTSPPPSETPTPTLSPTPTETSTPSATPIAWGMIPLSPDNALSIIQKGVWGLGSPQDSGFSISKNVYVQGTPFGIYLYQANDLQLIRFLPDTGKFFLASDGDFLFTRLSDGSIQVVELPSGEEKFVFASIAVLSPDMKDFIYSQLPADRPFLEKYYFDQVSSLRALATSQDGDFVAIGFGDASIGLWNLSDGSLVSQLKNDIVQDVSGLVFSPDGTKLLSSGKDGEIAVWQVDNGQLLWRLPHIGHIVGQPFSMDGSLVAMEITQETSSWVAVRETRYGGELAPQVVGRVASQAISPDDKRLVTTWYGAVKIYSLPNLIYQAKIESGLDWPQASYSPDGKYILINSGEQAYFASDLSRDETYQAPTPNPTPEVSSTALLKMGYLSGVIGLRYPQPVQAYAWGTLSDHEAWVWDLSNNVQATYDFGSPFMANPDLSFSGDRLAACTDSGLQVIDLADRQSSNLGQCRASAEVRFSADGNMIFRANGILIDALDSHTGELQYNLRGQSFLVEDIAITSDGTYLVSSSNFQHAQGREVIWWQVDQPKQLWRWMVNVQPDQYLYGAEFDNKNNLLHMILGGLQSWRLGDGQLHHRGAGWSSLALSLDNSLLATGVGGDVYLTSPETWQEFPVLSGHVLSVVGLGFSPDGTGLLSLSTDGTIRLWGLP